MPGLLTFLATIVGTILWFCHSSWQKPTLRSVLGVALVIIIATADLDDGDLEEVTLYALFRRTQPPKRKAKL